MHCVVAVPARLESRRLPGKVLADIGNKPMLQWVLEACALASAPAAVILCTDNQDLIDRACIWGFQGLLTSSSCQSGSERIAEVADQLVLHGGGNPDNTLVINVQGDQPFIDPTVIDTIATEFARRSPIPEVLTPVYRMGAEMVDNPNVVKTLLASDGQAIYFSRSAIPHVRGVAAKEWPEHKPYWGHVGIYGYRADVLMQWNQFPYSKLEHAEKLEQLRLIEAGVQIGTIIVEGEFLSVDSPEQLEQARIIAESSTQKQHSSSKQIHDPD